MSGTGQWVASRAPVAITCFVFVSLALYRLWSVVAAVAAAAVRTFPTCLGHAAAGSRTT